jgi:hypothetical protein
MGVRSTTKKSLLSRRAQDTLDHKLLLRDTTQSKMKRLIF